MSSEYQPLGHDGKTHTPFYRERAIQLVGSILIILIATYLLILSPILGFFADAGSFSHCPASVPDTSILKAPCGSTPAEARAAGCLFDPNSFLWSHPRCYNAELVEEFLAARNWTWYADPTLERVLSLDEVKTGEFDLVVVNMEYHVQHCLFMFKMMHRQALGPLGKMAVDSYLSSYNHTSHCAHIAGEQRDVPGNIMNTKIHLKYPDCGIE